MARRRIDAQEGRTALEAWAAEDEASRTLGRRTTATAVRYLLEELTARFPGGTVEVRVPPFGVTQCVEGPDHTRGTPPNVVEMPPQTWLNLATGRLTWEEAQRDGEVHASGTRADLAAHLPLVRV